MNLLKTQDLIEELREVVEELANAWRGYDNDLFRNQEEHRQGMIKACEDGIDILNKVREELK